MPKTVPDADKAETKTVSLPASMWARIDAHEEGRSGYIKRLVERDLAGLPGDENARELVEMALRFARIMTGAQLSDAISQETNADVIKAMLGPLREKSMADLHKQWMLDEQERLVAHSKAQPNRGGQIKKSDPNPRQGEKGA